MLPPTLRLVLDRGTATLARRGNVFGLRTLTRYHMFPRSASSLTRTRSMSTSPGSPVKHKFIVYAPDKTDEGTFERRLSIRPTHMDNAKQLNQDGLLLTGGAMLTPESIAPDASSKKMVGSVVIYKAETLEKVRRIVESDVYYTSGVWDPQRIVILPFALALPWPQN